MSRFALPQGLKGASPRAKTCAFAAAALGAAFVLIVCSVVTPARVFGATPTLTTVSANVNPAIAWDKISFSAVVAPSPGVGSIGWIIDGVYAGSTSLSLAGQTVLTRKLSAGTHTVSAAFAGNADFASSIGRMTEVVDAPTITVSSVTADDTELGSGTGRPRHGADTIALPLDPAPMRASGSRVAVSHS